MDKFDLDFSVVTKLTGHSQARSYRTKDQVPGMAITYALIRLVEKMAEVSDRARVVTKATVTELLVLEQQVVGVQYTRLGPFGSCEGLPLSCSQWRFSPVDNLCSGSRAAAGRSTAPWCWPRGASRPPHPARC